MYERMTDDEKMKRLGEISIKLDHAEVDLKEFQQRWDISKPLPSMALDQMKRLISKHNKLVKQHNKLCPDNPAEYV